MKKFLSLSLIALSLIIAGCGSAPLGAEDVARVGEMVITMEDIDSEILRIPPYQRTSFETLRGKRALLDHIIERELLLLAARDEGLAEDSTVLAMVGSAEQQVNEVRTRAMGQVFYQTMIIESIEIPDSLVVDYYDGNIQQYRNDPVAMVSHILVHSDETLVEAQALLDGGMPFDSVAIQLSEHSATAPLGGSIGWTGERLEIPFVGEDRELLSLLLSTEPGTILPAYETNLGTHIFMVLEQKPESYDSLDEVKESIEDMLRPALVNDYFRNIFMPGLHDTYGVTVNDTPVDGVYAVIDETSITEEQILAELEAIPPYQRASYETPEGKQLILESMIEKELIRLASIEAGLDQDSSVVAQVEQAQKQVEETMKGALIQEYYQRYIVETAEVAEEDITAYYEDHTGDIYRQHAQIQVSAIVSDSDQEMNEVLAALEQGMTFEDAASQFSSHSPTSANGGDLGWVPMNAPVPYILEDLEFAEEMYIAESGTEFGPVRTNLGVTLFKITDRLEDGVKPLSEVRESIQAALRPGIVNDYLYNTVFPRLREKYVVEINEAAFLPSVSIGADSLMTMAQGSMGTDPETAVVYFKLFLDRYPENERCDQAQFLIGFTFSEQMKDFDSARGAFRVLVQEYPESELADDAEWMIENMEIPIEDFIPIDVDVHVEEHAGE
ncbi:MAG: peptidyl-prolyl cis-trans isomerase [Candidatus Sabulitectum sp.]|nr:peptidyl-prolyl cis-trans isomerase [Candidatus Sabulitectum sp.]